METTAPATATTAAVSAAATVVTEAVPVVRGAGEGARRWFAGGGVHTWMATEEETAGAFLLFEDEMEQGKMTPLHVHPDSDESMFVLEGELLVHLDGAEHRLPAGAFVMAPRGVPHAFLVVSPTARMLCLHTPARCQGFYWQASDPLGDGDPGSGAVDLAQVMSAAAANPGIEILGPPPFTAR